MLQHWRWRREWHFPGGGAHRSGTFWTLSFVEASGQEIAARARPEDKVMIYGDQAFGSSLLFYLRRPIELVEGRTTSMWFGSTFPDAPKIYLSDADLQQDWAATSAYFCLCRRI